MKIVGRKHYLWTIALVLDFTSPKSPSILKQPFPPIEKIVLYPIRANDPDSFTSSCHHLLEKFVTTDGLKKWTDELKPLPKGDRPVAAAVRKIAFDVKFRLHPINQIVWNAPDQDSCGQDVCKEISELESMLRTENRSVQLLIVSNFNCKLAKNSPIVVEDLRQQSPEKITARARFLAMVKPGEAEMVKPPVVKGTITLGGPPVRVLFTSSEEMSPKGKPVVLGAQVPSRVRLPIGKWQMTIGYPSWANSAPGIEIEVKEKNNEKIDLKKAFDDQLDWIEPPKNADELLVYDADKHVLIPLGSPPIPMPKDISWKLYPAAEPSPVPTPTESSQ